MVTLTAKDSRSSTSTGSAVAVYLFFGEEGGNRMYTNIYGYYFISVACRRRKWFSDTQYPGEFNITFFCSHEYSGAVGIKWPK